MSDYSDFKPSKLGEISRPRQWPTISHEVIRRVGLYPVYGANGVIGFYDSYTHEKPTVAITCRGSTCGEIHLTPEKSYITGNAMALDDLNTSRLDQRYLYHFLKHDGLKDCITGSAQPQIIGSALKDFLVWHPSLESQRLIARILDTLDIQIQKTEALIAKLEKVKEGLLHDLLTRGIDDSGRLRPSPEQAPELYKESPLGLIPREWEYAAISKMMTSTTLGTARRGGGSSPKLKLIKMGNLNWGNKLSLTDIENISASKVSKSLLLRDGDLLFNTRNTPELVGKTCSWKGEGDLFTFDNNILRIRFSEHTNGHFVSSYMGSTLGRKRIRQLATGTTSVAAIYWRNLSRLEIPMPSPREQKLIVEKVSSLQNNIDSLRGDLMSRYRLKSGLMDDLLTGRVRVTPLLDTAQATTPA
ncbi:type I restriction enzyme S subunit [Kushneria sinocarnis]|uniref:Type I restriction enzyme S subunit n=1 Tax=Kushneria sinocarnis TaxID=595502 RepID=A0A420WSI7_9GAMM|nr:restriction endonuclease subunit S [Kushneria sinocarnis]RKQ95410.1 type I restriction enzyme S subunit [Kushneria sinocarnis]